MDQRLLRPPRLSTPIRNGGQIAVKSARNVSAKSDSPPLKPGRRTVAYYARSEIGNRIGSQRQKCFGKLLFLLRNQIRLQRSYPRKCAKAFKPLLHCPPFVGGAGRTRPQPAKRCASHQRAYSDGELYPTGHGPDYHLPAIAGQAVRRAERISRQRPGVRRFHAARKGVLESTCSSRARGVTR